MTRSRFALRFAAAAALSSAFLAAPAPALAAPGWAEAQPLTVRYHDPYRRLFDFDVDTPDRYAPGEIIFFSARGEPRSRVMARIEDPSGDRLFALREIRPGLYEGRYRVRSEDDFERPRFVVELTRAGELSWASASSRPAPRSYGQPMPVCQSCGVVESSQIVEPRPGEARADEHLLTVRMDSGETRRFWFSEHPRFYPGQRVRLEGSRVVLD